MALDNLATTLRDDEAVYIDMQELARSRISVRDLPTERLMLSDEAVEKKQAEIAQKQQKQEALQEEALRATIRKELADAFKATSQAKKNLDGADAAIFNAVMAAIEKGLDPDVIKRFAQEPPAATVQQPPVAGLGAGQGVAAG
jgi:ATP-dependent Clp protease ATP-binding subunit ClpA